jgi:hypothetical protein
MEGYFQCQVEHLSPPVYPDSGIALLEQRGSTPFHWRIQPKPEVFLFPLHVRVL